MTSRILVVVQQVAEKKKINLVHESLQEDGTWRESAVTTLYPHHAYDDVIVFRGGRVRVEEVDSE